MFVPGPAHYGLARTPLLPADPSETVGGTSVVAEGMFLASRDIPESPGEDRRHAQTARAYHLRAQHRPTPQGVFAGIADLDRTTGPARLHLGAAHRPVSYPNPAWLHHLCDQALDDPDVLHGLTFTTNALIIQRGDRFEAERPGGDDTEPMRVSVRATPAAALILQTASRGATRQTIVAALIRTWPSVPGSVIDQTLRALTRDGLLECDLFPDDVRAAPVAHVLKHLPATHRFHEPLTRLHVLLDEADSHPAGTPARFASLHTARQLCDAITEIGRPLCVDTGADARVHLPEPLAIRAAEAATALWRTTTNHDPLRSWHARFLDRYGLHRLVPLLEATDEITGLGIHTEPEPPRHTPRRDAVLTELYSRSITEGNTEVVLDEATIDALSTRSEHDTPPASAEIHARVIARSVTDRDAGEYRLAITRTGQPAGAARGRFTTLLPSAPAAAPDTGPIEAELAFTPRFHIGAALTSHPGQAPYRIRLGGNARDDDLLLNELMIHSNGHRLMLWSPQRERHIIPVHRNPIGHDLMPALAGWLCLLGQHPAAPLTRWSWGPVQHAPFLPRVICGDTILAAARWRLPESLTNTAGCRSSWAQALHNWRHRTTPTPPRVVVTDDDDRQIPLDLDRDDDCELLRRYVRRGLAAVSEPHGGSDTVQAIVPGPHGHHILEAVFPLTTSTPEAAPHVSLPRGRPRERGQGLHLPGGEWLSLAITAPPLAQDDILDRIAELIGDTARLWDRWFWLRYRTDALGPHLRLRFHGKPGALHSELLSRLNELCGRLVSDRLSSGFTIEAYTPEVERYGGPEAIGAVENVFGHDSFLCLELLRASREPDARIAAAAVSAAAIVRIVADANLSALEPYRLTSTDRATFNRVRPLARRLDDAGHLASPDAWHARTAALHTWRDLLPTNRTIDCASSAVHMHANRMIGDNRTERIIRALAKDLITRRAS